MGKMRDLLDVEGSIGGKELNLEDTVCSELKAAAALFNIIFSEL